VINGRRNSEFCMACLGKKTRACNIGANAHMFELTSATKALLIWGKCKLSVHGNTTQVNIVTFPSTSTDIFVTSRSKRHIYICVQTVIRGRAHINDNDSIFDFGLAVLTSG
jgi:hypothetical protein